MTREEAEALPERRATTSKKRSSPECWEREFGEKAARSLRS